MGVLRFNRPVINVADMERTLSFYRDLLGMQLVSDNRTTDPERVGIKDTLEKAWSVTNLDLRWVVLAMPDAIEREVEFLWWGSPKPRSRSRDPIVSDNGVAWCGFAVEGLGALYEQLKKAGIKFLGPLVERQTPTGARGICYALDPDNYVVELGGSL